jgi:hypothetical protein
MHAAADLFIKNERIHTNEHYKTVLILVSIVVYLCFRLFGDAFVEC